MPDRSRPGPPRSDATSGARRLLPDARRLQAARWALWRWRHLVAAGAIGLAAAAVVGELRPAPPPTQPTVVLRSAIEAGTAIASRDVRVVEVPDELVPDGSFTAAAQVVGESAAVALSERAVLTSDVLVGARGAPPGAVITPVRVSDPALAAFLGPGDRVDVVLVPHPDGLASWPAEASSSEPATVVLAERALVLPRPGAGERPSGGLLGGSSAQAEADDDGVLLVAVAPHEARALTASAGSGYIGAVIVE